MTANNTPYEILVGPVTLYLAAALTAMPDVEDTPSASWREIGDTDGGVTVNLGRSLEFHRTDQSLGPKKATVNEINPKIEFSLAETTLENMADALGQTVTDTPPGSGTVGTRKMGLGQTDVEEFAILLRGKSAYGNYPSQYYIGRGVFDGDIQLQHTKTGKTVIPLTFAALEDTSAAEADKFGVLVMQDAAALP